MKPYYSTAGITLYVGDCLDVLPGLPAESVDAVVTDPPYGLKFMGKQWDHGVPGVPFWEAVLRVAKPGAHLLAFGGTRTSHRLVCAIEDAGWEIRDTIMWVYGSGFPKSLDVSKAIDKILDWSKVERLSQEIRRARASAGLSLKQIGEAMQRATGGQYGRWYHRGGHMFFETGRSLPSRPEWDCLRNVLPIAPEFQDTYNEAEREVLKTDIRYRSSDSWEANGRGMMGKGEQDFSVTAPATDAAKQWDGWGTALKPAVEPICLARKPLVGTVASNVQRYGTGALNIDASRIPSEAPIQRAAGTPGFGVGRDDGYAAGTGREYGTVGRWPANLILSYPEDEYELRPNVSAEQVRELYRWLSENP